MSLKWVFKIVAVVGAVSVISVIGCGSDSGSSRGDTMPSNSSFSGTCCLNGSYYKCPDPDAVSKCSLDTGPGDCTRDSSKDDTCK